MLFHDSTFTIEQERYHQENIEWTFSEMVMSPLSIIDVIDRHIPQVLDEQWFHLPTSIPLSPICPSFPQSLII